MNFSDAYRINEIMRNWVRDMRETARVAGQTNSVEGRIFEQCADSDEAIRKRFAAENGLEDEL